MKKVVISCGPIPARLDSVKFITNRFKGGLAFLTARHLIDRGTYDVTIVKWVHTPLPKSKFGGQDDIWDSDRVHIVNVQDVFEYYNWYKDNAQNYSGFIMAAAVANLTPSNPWEGKFPSHNYKVGEKFNIEFEIAPRAIDIIKQINPRATLIGYKLFDAQSDAELIDIARHTLKDAKANIIFANTPAEAKSRKIAVMADNAAISCTFDEHIEMITQILDAEYFRTIVEPLTDEEKQSIGIREALATVRMYDKTFKNGFGTCAVPVQEDDKHGLEYEGYFATTSRGHNGDAVIIRGVDFENRTVYATGKATLNAPTLKAILRRVGTDKIIVHRHDDDELFNNGDFQHKFTEYLFPGTVDEALEIGGYFKCNPDCRHVKLYGHGDISVFNIKPVDWSEYYNLFPSRYFSTPSEISSMAEEFKGKETLEIGANKESCCKYSYDPYVQAENAINLSWSEVLDKRFDLIVIKNAINYLTYRQLRDLVGITNRFIANTFLIAPEEKVTANEAAILYDGKVYHTLRLPDGQGVPVSSGGIMRHTFYAHSKEDYEKLGLKVTPYGKNSALVEK